MGGLGFSSVDGVVLVFGGGVATCAPSLVSISAWLHGTEEAPPVRPCPVRDAAPGRLSMAVTARAGCALPQKKGVARISSDLVQATEHVCVCGACCVQCLVL